MKTEALKKFYEKFYRARWGILFLLNAFAVGFSAACLVNQDKPILASTMGIALIALIVAVYYDVDTNYLEGRIYELRRWNKSLEPPPERKLRIVKKEE